MWLISCSVSTFYLVGLFDLWAGTRTLAISSAAAYCMAKYIDGPFMPWIAFVFLMGHLSVNQLARQFANDPGVVDITGAQMVLVMKLTSFCWNVADGRQPEAHLSDEQKEKALKQLPSLLDFAGYVLFFPSLFAGPAFDYVDYKRWIETTMFEVPAGTDPSKRAPTRSKRKIPRSATPAMWKLAKGLGWILLFLKLSGSYNPALVTGDDYMKYGFFRRVWLLHMLGFTSRLKYYGVWAMTEGSCILSGLGYKGVDPATGKVSWDRLRNVDPWAVETAQNTRAYLGAWNINTNNWLRNYVYLRVTPRGKKPGFRASMATFTTSAFWHGFYPGYYLSFLLASFVQTVAKSKRDLPTSTTRSTNKDRFPPLFPPILPGPKDYTTDFLQDLLRRFLLPHHPTLFLVHRRALRPACPSSFLPRLVTRIFLRRHRHCPLDSLLRIASQSITGEESA